MTTFDLSSSGFFPQAVNVIASCRRRAVVGIPGIEYDSIVNIASSEARTIRNGNVNRHIQALRLCPTGMYLRTRAYHIALVERNIFSDSSKSL